MHRRLHLLVVVLAVAAASGRVVLAATPAPTDAAIGKIPERIIAALAAHDAAAVSAMCVPDATVVDEFPPYLWTAPGACTRFARDFSAVARDAHLTGITAVTKATVVTRSLGRVYAVTRVTLTLLVGGKTVREDGTWTFVVMRSGGAWKIASMTWATIPPLAS
jgi:ketosteroid isomerase-like protein